MRLKSYYEATFGGFNFRVYKSRGGWRAKVRVRNLYGANYLWKCVLPAAGSRPLTQAPQRDVLRYLAYAYEGKEWK
jgi:hypothetical protein